LASCYRSAIRLAVEHGLRSLAFPAISCGVFGYPISAAASVACSALAEAMHGAAVLEQVLLTAMSEEVESALKAALKSEA